MAAGELGGRAWASLDGRPVEADGQSGSDGLVIGAVETRSTAQTGCFPNVSGRLPPASNARGQGLRAAFEGAGSTSTMPAANLEPPDTIGCGPRLRDRHYSL
jgi:hypothetical protein